MMKPTTGKYLLIVCYAIILLSVISIASGVFKLGKDAFVNPDVRAEKTALYRDLFKESVQDSLRSDNTFFYDYRAPFSIFTYNDKGNKFKVIIWKYATKSIDEPLSVTLTDTKYSMDIGGRVFQGVKAGYYDIFLTKDSVSKINNMYLDLKGEDIIKIEDDKKLIYRLIPEKLSISNKKGGNEIWKIENVLHEKYQDKAEVAFFSDGTQCYLGFLFPLIKNSPNEVSLANLLIK